jgi:hypothetical protein
VRQERQAERGDDRQRLAQSASATCSNSLHAGRCEKTNLPPRDAIGASAAAFPGTTPPQNPTST